MHGHRRIVEFLIQNGADVNAGNGLCHAVNAQHVQIVEYMIKHGARVDQGDGANSLAKVSFNGNMQIFEFLMNGKVDIHDPRCRQALATAATQKHFQIVKRLVEKGFNVNASTDWHATPLLNAMENGDSEMGIFLVEHNADVNISDMWGNTPLMVACQKIRSPQMIQLLLSRGALIHKTNNNNENALFFAVRANNTHNAKILIGKGIDVNLKNKNKQNVVDVAMETNNHALAVYLIKRGAMVMNDVKLKIEAHFKGKKP